MPLDAFETVPPDTLSGRRRVALRQHPRHYDIVERAAEAALRSSPGRRPLARDVDEHLEGAIHRRVLQDVPCADVGGRVVSLVVHAGGGV